MSDPRFIQEGFEKRLAHAIEECAEFIQAATKIQRWGPNSVNPLLPPEQQETNLAWMCREMVDARLAFNSLEEAMAKEGL